MRWHGGAAKQKGCGDPVEHNTDWRKGDNPLEGVS